MQDAVEGISRGVQVEANTPPSLPDDDRWRISEATPTGTKEKVLSAIESVRIYWFYFFVKGQGTVPAVNNERQ